MGYVGLPLGVAFAEAGFRTIGFDLQAATVELLQRGESHIADIQCERVKQLRQAEKFSATTNFDELASCNVAIICVPTPLTDSRDPDLAAVRSAAEAIARNLRRGQLIVLESTTYPGTTDEVVRPILEANGLVAGQDFFLAFSPERIDPGNINFPFEKVPKVVGGHSVLCGQLAQELYSTVVNKVVPVSSTHAAELTKLLENIFRSVNIALVNELALLCDRMGIDVWEVIDAAATKPYGFTKFSPGPGLGGHCIPIDPYYLAWKAREYDFETRFIQLAGEINRSMPHYVIDKITRALNDESRAVRGSRIALLGMSYKPNVGDCRESPSLRVAELLIELGADVIYHDPYVQTARIATEHFESQPIEAILAADCIVLLTDHREYDYEAIAAASPLIVDTRNAFKDVTHPRARIVKL
jgi:UDP-N-acetyl-D-glucosamine dehydrogenase